MADGMEEAMEVERKGDTEEELSEDESKDG